MSEVESPKGESQNGEVQNGEPANDAHLSDHTYDGIQEFDNPMPRWWVRFFWASAVFALGYTFHYTVGNGHSVLEEHEGEIAEVRAVEAKKALAQAVSETTLKAVLADQNMVSAGKSVFATRCQPCHADQGQGNIGPNLTDMQWIHGGHLMEIYQTVSSGVASKGMPAWQRQLSPTELRQVVAFVGSLRGKNVPGKGPEGQAIDASILAQ